MSFEMLGVSPRLVAALARQDITGPTPIQSAALPVLLAGSDACLHAETGTGKTLAYLLPILQRLELEPAATQAVILAPTHELAIQVHRQCIALAQDAGLAVRALLLIGGTSKDRQLEKLKQRPHVVVGSPGRIGELMAMGKLKTAAVRTLVVDEADRLLSGESLPAVRALLDRLPPVRQLVFASATRQAESSAAIAAIAPGAAMLQPGAAEVNRDIAHFYVVCELRDRIKLLRQLLAALRPERALVFAQDRDLADRAADQLAHHHVAVAALHPELGKQERQRAMEDFRKGRVRVLVASDLAARGLDFPQVTHVFNLDAPLQARAYLHRVGRTARGGRSGEAVTLLGGEQLRLVRRYEQDLGIALQRVTLRGGEVHLDPEPARPSSRRGPARPGD